VSPPIVSVQKKPYPKPFKAFKRPVRLAAYDKFNVTPLTTIDPVPQDKTAEVISHEYLVVAFIE
jgi:hypothetical protein